MSIPTDQVQEEYPAVRNLLSDQQPVDVFQRIEEIFEDGFVSLDVANGNRIYRMFGRADNPNKVSLQQKSIPTPIKSFRILSTIEDLPKGNVTEFLSGELGIDMTIGICPILHSQKRSLLGNTKGFVSRIGHTDEQPRSASTEAVLLANIKFFDTEATVVRRARNLFNDLMRKALRSEQRIRYEEIECQNVMENRRLEVRFFPPARGNEIVFRPNYLDSIQMYIEFSKRDSADRIKDLLVRESSVYATLLYISNLYKENVRNWES